MSKRGMWVFCDSSTRISQMRKAFISLLPLVGSPCNAIYIGHEEEVQDELFNDFDEVHVLNPDAYSSLANYAPSVAAILQESEAKMFVCDSSSDCQLVAGFVAASLGAAAICDVQGFDYDKKNAQVLFKRKAYGDKAIEMISPAEQEAWVVTYCGIPSEGGFDFGGRPSIVSAKVLESDQKCRLVDSAPRTDAGKTLSNADRVICIGGGLDYDADLSKFEALANGLNAELGCTRGLRNVPVSYQHAHQIGISGFNVEPRIYFGFGVSGQVQHTIGITNSRVIVAINKDPNAPLFDQCDYGYVGDARDFARELLCAYSAFHSDIESI